MARKVFEGIRDGLEDAIAYARGTADLTKFGVHRLPGAVNVRSIRRGIGLTQRAFADRYGFTLARIRDWEQGRSQPDSAARAFLIVIEREREAVERALWAA